MKTKHHPYLVATVMALLLHTPLSHAEVIPAPEYSGPLNQVTKTAEEHRAGAEHHKKRSITHN